MKLEKIITLSNKKMELRFLAMVRSLRATGCNLPVWVIPYDENKFELPENCIWWEMEEVINWVVAEKTHPTMRKYQCLLTANYQFVDSDVVFLRNPEGVLSGQTGFIPSCCHWQDPGHTYTEESLKIFQERSTTWQREIFNTGQYACDEIMFTFKSLKATASDPRYRYTCLDFEFHEQPGINLLVHLSGFPINNLTFPPYLMESTWAGDYTTADYAKYWKVESRKPYIIHWAGCQMDTGRPIDELFLQYLSDDEKKAWEVQVSEKTAQQNAFAFRMRRNLSMIKNALTSLEFK